MKLNDKLISKAGNVECKIVFVGEPRKKWVIEYTSGSGKGRQKECTKSFLKKYYIPLKMRNPK